MYNNNIRALKKNYPSLYERIVSNIPSKNSVSEETRVGIPTLRYSQGEQTVYLHSKYNPIKEAQAFAQGIEFKNEPIILYGFGLGYHLKSILPNLNSKLYVFDLNLDIFSSALALVDLTDIINHPLVELVISENAAEVLGIFQQLLALDGVQLLLHRPSMEVIPNEYQEFKLALFQYKLQENTITRFLPALKENFNSNIKYELPLANELLSEYTNQSVFLVAAGPSLDKNGHLLTKINKGKIVAVGTALKPLLRQGIQPDLVVISDPHPLVAKQFEQVDYQGPWVILSTAYKSLIDLLAGKKYIALQAGFEATEEMAKIHGVELFNTGGSVATFALDFILKARPQRLVFVGQDLAFTNGQYHANNTFHTEKLQPKQKGLKIEAYNGGYVETSLSLYSYLKWIEQRIKSENVEIINATEGGASIKGTLNKGLKEVIEDLI